MRAHEKWLRGRTRVCTCSASARAPRARARSYGYRVGTHTIDFEQREHEHEGQHGLDRAFCTYKSTAPRYGGYAGPILTLAITLFDRSKGSEIDSTRRVRGRAACSTRAHAQYTLVRRLRGIAHGSVSPRPLATPAHHSRVPVKLAVIRTVLSRLKHCA